MKKLLAGVLLGTALFTVACGQEEAQSEAVVEEVVADVVEEVEPVAEIAGDIVINGYGVNIGTNLTKEVIANLGTPLETLEAPSCHFDGNDTLYVYDGYTLYAYQDGEENILYIIELDGQNISTPQGATVGMTRDDIFEIYGEATEEYAMVSEFDLGEVVVAVTFDDEDLVSYIEIM